MEGVNVLPLMLSQAVKTAWELIVVVPIEIYCPPISLQCGCILIPPPYAVFQFVTHPIGVYIAVEVFGKVIHSLAKDSTPNLSDAPHY